MSSCYMDFDYATMDDDDLQWLSNLHNATNPQSSSIPTNTEQNDNKSDEQTNVSVDDFQFVYDYQEDSGPPQPSVNMQNDLPSTFHGDVTGALLWSLLDTKEKEEIQKSKERIAKRAMGVSTHIQWQTLRKMITWNRILSDGMIQKKKWNDPLVSFYDLARCHVQFPRGFADGDRYSESDSDTDSDRNLLTGLWRSHRQVDTFCILSYWCRIIKIVEMEDIFTIIFMYFFDNTDIYIDISGKHKRRKKLGRWNCGFSIFGVWIARNKKASLKGRQVNQSRFFKELESICTVNALKEIAGVSFTFKKKKKSKKARKEKVKIHSKSETTTLGLYANGAYVFGWEKSSATWYDDCSDSEMDYVSHQKETKHCGAWSYEGNQITMEGLGFRKSGCEYDYDTDDDESVKLKHFTEKLEITNKGEQDISVDVYFH